MDRTMGWRFDGRLLVLVHGPQSPKNLEWERMLTEALERGNEAERRVLVVSYGGGPDAHQRKRLAGMIGSTPALTAIMTNSSVGRAIGAALGFFNRRMKIVELNDPEKALAHLNVTAEERSKLVRIRVELERELGVGQSGARAV